MNKTITKSPSGGSKGGERKRVFTKKSKPFSKSSGPKKSSGGSSSYSKSTGGSSYSKSAGSYSGSRPSSGGSKAPSSYNRGGNGGGRGPSRFSSKKKRFERKSTADVTKFVRKATPVEDKALPAIKHVFADFNFSKEVQANLVAKNYVAPTNIQDEAIPYVLAGRDVVGLANTGTGKTAAFLLPLIDKVWKDKNQNVLILAPTRELAMQIDKEFRGFSYGMHIYSAMCVGGMPIWKQINELSRKPNFIIGTPGRIKDLSEKGKINYSQINNIVLDEVDHMLDMGFVEPITDILNHLKPERQSLFFSATMPANIKKLINTFTKDPVTVEIASRSSISNIDQDVVKITDQTQKYDKLKDILIQPGFDKVLIFTETKRQVDKLFKDLLRDGFKAESIHGDKRQSQRRKAIDLFDKDKVNILIATDVAARGLDIKEITHVINYTIPNTHEDYTHRIGRTGRGNKTGNALTFI